MLALAIGAVTAVAGVVHAALLRPLPHVDVDRWADLFERPVQEGLGGRLSVSIPNYRDWRDQSRTFAALVLWRPWSVTVAGDAQAPERLRAAMSRLRARQGITLTSLGVQAPAGQGARSAHTGSM